MKYSVVAGDLSLRGCGPVALDGFADRCDRAAIVRIHFIHGFEHRGHLAVVVAILQSENVPAIGCPLADEIVAVETGGDDAADFAAYQAIVDARIVVGNHHAQALAHLQRQRLRLELLRMTFGERKFAFKGDHLWRGWRSYHVPESGLARGRRDADPGRPSIHVIGAVGAFGVARERSNPAAFRLREPRVVFQTSILQQRPERSRSPAEPQSVDGQHRDLRVDVIAPIARLLILAIEGLAHDHPQGIAGRD